MSQLNDAIEMIGTLTFDELTDVMDYVRYHITETRDVAVRPGLPSIQHEPFNYAENCAAYRIRSGEAQFMRRQTYRRNLEKSIGAFERLPNTARTTAELVALIRLQDIAPVRNRRHNEQGEPVASGSVRVKAVKGNPYLYYNYQLSAGNRDKRKSRHKSEYIGRPDLAGYIYEHLPYRDETKRPLRRRALHKLRDVHHDVGLLEEREGDWAFTLDDLIAEIET